VDFVVDHQDFLGPKAPPLDQTPHGMATAVHPGLGQGQQHLTITSHPGVALGPGKGHTPTPGYLLDHPKAHVVAGGEIGLTGIAETDEKAPAAGLGVVWLSVVWLGVVWLGVAVAILRPGSIPRGHLPCDHAPIPLPGIHTISPSPRGLGATPGRRDRGR